MSDYSDKIIASYEKDIKRLENQYADGLDAWRNNNVAQAQEIERLKAIIVGDTEYKIKYAKAQEEIERLRGRKECKCNE